MYYLKHISTDKGDQEKVKNNCYIVQMNPAGGSPITKESLNYMLSTTRAPTSYESLSEVVLLSYAYMSQEVYLSYYSKLYMNYVLS